MAVLQPTQSSLPHTEMQILLRHPAPPSPMGRVVLQMGEWIQVYQCPLFAEETVLHQPYIIKQYTKRTM